MAVDERFQVLVPLPRSITPTEGMLVLSNDGEPRPVAVEVGAAVERSAWLIEYLSRLPGLGTATAARSENALTIHLEVTDQIEGLGGIQGPEAYRLEITTEAITVSGSDASGLFWGIQTLRQLLPASAGGGLGHIAIPTGTIVDAPRFAWRGLMVDVARHFFGVHPITRIVDAMALYKLNRLHLHLSDDQGWRLAIHGYPELTDVGGTTQVGDGPGGYFTQAEYSELVTYAEARHVTVVPEIDLPGHTNAALSSVPELNCDGVATAPYRGIDVGFSSLCIGTPATERFVDAVLSQVARLTPGPYLHIGGDEAGSTSPVDYKRFIESTDAKVRELNKTMIGWEDFVVADLHPTTVAQVWRDERGPRIAAQNLRIIASPAAHTYLDQKYDDDMDIGFTWAGLIDTRRAYEWDPTQLGGATELGALPAGTESTRSTPEDRILGVEGPLWTETVEHFDQLCRLAFPRSIALAEVGWTDIEQRDWSDFSVRFAGHGERLAGLGITMHDDPALGS